MQKGWLEKRRNPRLPLDKTYQYCVNVSKIQSDLLALGYNLEGYNIELVKPKSDPEEDNSEEEADSILESKNKTSKSNNLTSESEKWTQSRK